MNFRMFLGLVVFQNHNSTLPSPQLIYLSAFSNLMDVLHIPLHMIVGSNVKDMYLYSFPIPTPTSLSLQEFSSWIRSDFISDQRLRNI
jgi:hypothetical protein